ncbi:hypothetical protein ACFXHA_38275 [Nocardia sp. NPDC059240]|uniref:hypothetical protein n=1 Tax=Nocardia sp. NPDC059240 TaxID=3346786 RepID=UPI0036A2AF17
MYTPKSSFSATQSEYAQLVAKSPEANGVYCNHCGATPAIDLDFHAHRAMFVISRYRKLMGPFCRDCGLASFRKMTGDSLIQGWWGPFSAFVSNPNTLLANTINRVRLRRLPPPIPGAPTLPMDPGRPLWQRPAIAGLLVPIIAPCLVLAGMINAPTPADPQPDHRDLDRFLQIYQPVNPQFPVPTTVPARAAN